MMLKKKKTVTEQMTESAKGASAFVAEHKTETVAVLALAAIGCGVAYLYKRSK